MVVRRVGATIRVAGSARREARTLIVAWVALDLVEDDQRLLEVRPRACRLLLPEDDGRCGLRRAGASVHAVLRRGRCARAWLTVFGSHESWANSTPLSELLALDSIEPCSSMTVQTSAPFGARRRMGDWMAAVVDTASDMELRPHWLARARVDGGKHADGILRVNRHGAWLGVNTRTCLGHFVLLLLCTTTLTI